MTVDNPNQTDNSPHPSSLLPLPYPHPLLLFLLSPLPLSPSSPSLCPPAPPPSVPQRPTPRSIALVYSVSRNRFGGYVRLR